jgi:hypothetical protein
MLECFPAVLALAGAAFVRGSDLKIFATAVWIFLLPKVKPAGFEAGGPDQLAIFG